MKVKYFIFMLPISLDKFFWYEQKINYISWTKLVMFSPMNSKRIYQQFSG